MKDFIVLVEITVSKEIVVSADSEDEARRIVDNEITEDPFYNAGSAENYIGNKIVCCTEVK